MTYEVTKAKDSPPLPRKAVQTNKVYPFDSMKPGDTFALAPEGSENYRTPAQVDQASRVYASRVVAKQVKLGITPERPKFVVDTDPDDPERYLCWRVK